MKSLRRKTVRALSCKLIYLSVNVSDHSKDAYKCLGNCLSQRHICNETGNKILFFEEVKFPFFTASFLYILSYF